MTIDNKRAKIEFNPETEKFRGEILGLTGSADFYGKTVPELKKAFKQSLKTYIAGYKKNGYEPFKIYSGNFVARVGADLHEKISIAATAEGSTLNKWVKETLSQATKET